MKKVRLIGFCTLTFFVFLLLIFTLYNMFNYSKFTFILFLLLFIGVIITTYKSFIVDKVLQSVEKIFDIIKLKEMISVLAGSVITYLMVRYFKLSSVVASSLIGLIGAIFIKKYSTAIYCGSFVGMCSYQVLGLLPLVLASLLAGLIFIFSKDVFNGYGGKLGTIAFSCCLILIYITKSEYIIGNIYNNDEKFIIILSSILAAMLTYFLSIRLKGGPVFSSSIIGFIMGLILPIVFPPFGVTISLVIFGASFVGMTNNKILSNEGLIALAGIIFGFIFIYNFNNFGGAGGKLGASAFVSTLCIYGLYLIIKRIFFRKKENKTYN